MTKVTGARNTAQTRGRLPLDSRHEELAHILSRHRRGGELTLTDHRIEERRLRLLELHDLLLNRALGDQAVDVHLLVLADAVNTVHRLLFGGGVPPRIDNKHIVGLCQIKSYASGFQRDKEGLYVFLLGEMGNFGRPVVGCSCQ